MPRAALLAALVLAACSRPPEHPYPAEVVDAFVASCTKQAPEKTCRCTIDQLQRRLTLDEFKTLDQQARGGSVPKPLADAIAECASR